MNAFPCEFCHAKFHNEVELLVHIQEEHTKAKKFQSDCPSTYTESHNHNMPGKTCTFDIRTCFVPGCKSTYNGYPNKIFFSMPLDPVKREKWCRAVNRDPSSLPKTGVLCCENHFTQKNYVNDLLNHKQSGSYRLRLKEDVVPHNFVIPAEQSFRKSQESEDIIEEMKQSPISKEKKVDVQSKKLENSPQNNLYPSHLKRIPVDTQIKIESDPVDVNEDDWCVDNKGVNKRDLKLQDVKLNSNEANFNFIDYGNIKYYYTIEFEDEDVLDKVNHALKNDAIANESEKNEQNKNREDINCDVLVNMFQCNVCQTSFLKQEDMLQHIRVLHGTTNQYKSFISQKSMKHVEELINVKTKDRINKDNDFYEKNENLQKDNNIAIDFKDTDPNHNNLQCLTKRKHSCTICNKEYTYKSWKSHMKDVHGDKNHECTICGAKFTSVRYMNKHKLYRHENGIKSYEKANRQSCPECPKTFKNNDCLAHHIKNCHANQVECQLCFSRLKSPSYLKTHMRRVHYDDGKIHKCKICCKKFKSPRQVKIHMINLHPDTLHPCLHCKRLFCKAAQLKVHLKKCKPKNEPIDSATIKDEDDDEGEDDICLIID